MVEEEDNPDHPPAGTDQEADPVGTDRGADPVATVPEVGGYIRVRGTVVPTYMAQKRSDIG